MEFLTVLVVAILFAGALTRSTFGFGEALVAMPLLSLIIDIKVDINIYFLHGGLLLKYNCSTLIELISTSFKRRVVPIS